MYVGLDIYVDDRKWSNERHLISDITIDFELGPIAYLIFKIYFILHSFEAGNCVSNSNFKWIKNLNDITVIKELVNVHVSRYLAQESSWMEIW